MEGGCQCRRGFACIFSARPAVFLQGVAKKPGLRRAFRFTLPSNGSGRLLLVVILVDFLEIGVDNVTVLG
ncbi:hypothetical protein EN904_32745, partial [Mesorhizobium sp. M7A.F.Ca.CA.001.07.2.1]